MSELYYAEMEASRNITTEAYFAARHPSIDTPDNRKFFRDGYERAFSQLWQEPTPAQRE